MESRNNKNDGNMEQMMQDIEEIWIWSSKIWIYRSNTKIEELQSKMSWNQLNFLRTGSVEENLSIFIKNYINKADIYLDNTKSSKSLWGVHSPEIAKVIFS